MIPKPSTELTAYFTEFWRMMDTLDSLSQIAAQRDVRIVNNTAYPDLQPLFKSEKNHEGRSVASFIDEVREQMLQPFKIGVVGDFTRGKTTLINAILGRQLLVSDIRPNTATRTIIRFDENEHFRVKYYEGLNLSPIEGQDLTPQKLAEYTSDATVEEAYFGRLDGEKSLAEIIEDVEIWIKSDYLRSRNIELYDTPGLESMFEEHQVITYNTLPHLDTILFAIQANPGISDEEITFLASFKDIMSRFTFVITKIDQLETQKDRDTLVRFVTERIRAQTGLQQAQIYPVSALSALNNGEYQNSGMLSLMHGLDTFIAETCGANRLAYLHTLINGINLWLRHDIQDERTILEQSISIQQRQLMQAEQFAKRDEKLIDTITNSLIFETCYLTLLDSAISSFRNNLQTIVERQVDTMSLDDLAIANDLIANNIKILTKKNTAQIDRYFIQNVDAYLKIIKNTFEEIVADSVDFSIPPAPQIIEWTPSLEIGIDDASALTKLSASVGILSGTRNLVKSKLTLKNTIGQNFYDEIIDGENGLKEMWQHRFKSWSQSIETKVKNTIVESKKAYLLSQNSIQHEFINKQSDLSQHLAAIDMQMQTLKNFE